MVSQKVTVKNPQGLHARPAAKFYKAAISCESEILVKTENITVNPKDIMELMAALIRQGEEIEICVDGAKEKEELETLVKCMDALCSL